MGQFIIHHEGAFNLYTTIGDGACFESALTEEQLIEYMIYQYGESVRKSLPERIERAKRKGTSSMIDGSLSDVLVCNRAGKNEKHLSEKEFIKNFLTL